jgi:hypothetical protein
LSDAAVRAAAPADRASRLELARGLLRSMQDRSSARPPATPDAADGAVLPVAAPLAGLLPAGGLRRGATVALAEAPATTSLLLALLAGASAAGAWAGVVGRPDLGLVAAAEAGVRLDRLALVPHPGADLLAVASALLDGLDVVVVAGAARAGVRAADRQRLAARARQRGAVLLPIGPWPGADVELGCTAARWLGPGAGEDGGSGRLRARRVEVRARGRGIPPQGRGVQVMLPAAGGALGWPEPVEEAVGRERPVALAARVAG